MKGPFSPAFALLVEMESFDKEAFLEEDSDKRKVCSFVLALAVIYNDLKDLQLYHQLLGRSKPDGEFTFRKDWGEYNGLSLHITKQSSSLVHELLGFIDHHKHIVEGRYFQDIFNKVNKRGRLAWGSLVNTSDEKARCTKYDDIIFSIRNKVSFHYDAKEIMAGYEYHFLQSQYKDIPPLLSRGNQMESSRFYFADAAAGGYVDAKRERTSQQNFSEELNKLLDDINYALYNIVVTFIQQRGYAWRPFSPPK